MEEQEKEGEEYQVEDIVTHLEYVEAFELRGYIAFNPDSGHGLTHSKYVYLVKWLGYDDEANTWEPEENLVDCTEVLSIYKRKHGLPLYHETFSRQFNWIEPTTSLTKEEVNRLAFKNRDHDQITSASQLVRDPPTKKKRRDKETLQDFVVESDDDAVEYPPPKRKKRSPSVPAKTEQKGKRRRGPKPKQAQSQSDAPRKKPGRKPRSDSTSIKKESKESSVEKKSDEDSAVEVIRYVFDSGSRRSRSPVKRLLNSRRYSSAERLPERWFNAVEENAKEECLKMTREKLAKIITARFATSSEDQSHRRQMIVSMREKDTITEDEPRQYRVVGSSLLKKFLKENDICCKLPIITVPVPEPVKEKREPDEISEYLRKLDENCEGAVDHGDAHLTTDTPRTDCSLAELRKYANEQSIEDSVMFVKTVREKCTTETDNDLLTIALSYAELSYKLAIRILRSVSNEETRFDIVKDLVNTVRIFGNSNISRPDRPTTSSSSLALQLVESELNDGGWLEAVSHCSAAHWKCRLIYQLMTICPSPKVFIDASSPFSLQNFLHCMRYGAHCQKLAFISCGVPYGHATIECDFLDGKVDESHIAAMQGNPRYLFEFIRNGFDMNALTSNKSPSGIDADMTVSELLTSLIKMGNGCSNEATSMSSSSRSRKDSPSHSKLTVENVNTLKNIHGIITDWDRCLLSFIRDNVEQKLVSDHRCEVMFDRAVSPVHTIRVSAIPGCDVRTILFGNVPTPLLSRILALISKGKSAMVLCVYSVSIVYTPATGNSDGSPLPLRLRRTVSAGCTVQEASLNDEFHNYSCTLIPDTSSNSDSEWYFVLDVESLKHISTNTTSLRLKVSAPSKTTLLAQFVLVTRKDFDELESL